MLSGKMFVRYTVFPKASYDANGYAICNVMFVGDVGRKLHTSLSMAYVNFMKLIDGIYSISQIYCCLNDWSLVMFDHVNADKNHAQ